MFALCQLCATLCAVNFVPVLCSRLCTMGPRFGFVLELCLDPWSRGALELLSPGAVESCQPCQSWSRGAVVPWSPGALELWSRVSRVSCGAVEPWTRGAVNPGAVSAVEPWSRGAGEPWSPGRVPCQPWSPGAVEPWSRGGLPLFLFSALFGVVLRFVPLCSVRFVGPSLPSTWARSHQPPAAGHQMNQDA